MKKVIIIGGGIAGLTAGVYAQKKGFSVEIYEKNAMLGGECTGWDRQGYHIDNCIHWLTGCREEDGLYDIWRTTGALGEDTVLYREPYFYKLEMDGKELHFWTDLEKARAEFIALAPEDEVELNKFFDCVKWAECVQVPSEKSPADMSFIEFMKMGMSMADMAKVGKEYGKETVPELAQRFQNPMVQKMITGYFNNNFMANTLLCSYGFYTSKTAAFPMGGSSAMVQRMESRFKELGGKVFLNSSAKKINVAGKSGSSVVFEDGREITADFIICASDPAVTFGKLLDTKYMDKKLKKMYSCREGYAVSSGFQVAFGIIGEEDCGIDDGSVIFPCEEYQVGSMKSNLLGVRLYSHDENLYPKDKRVIQCNLLQDEEDFAYWKELYERPDEYNAEKQKIAEVIKERIVKKYPELEGKLTLLGTYTPVTFERWCGAYKGAYMSFYGRKGYKSLYVKNKIKGLNNVFLAGQWLQPNGGLPIAAASGKFVVDVLPQE